MKSATRMTPTTIAVLVWCLITGIFLLSTLGLYVWKGGEVFELLIQTGPITVPSLTLYSVAITWLLAGVFIFLLYFQKIHSGNVLTLVGFFIVSLLYLNVLRERPEYGDIQYYIRAANALHIGRPLPAAYIYPPFWAILLEPLVSLGKRDIFDILWLGNIASLFVFYFLLIRILQQYGFSERLAALVTAAFMVVNVPLLRTLVYVQVNLHVINLIFICLLLHRRSPFFSALALALAVHLKISPILLVLAFVFEKNWRWLVWFTFSMLLIGGFTLVNHGISPYLDFLKNITALNTLREVSFRENSLDSLFLALSSFLHIDNTLTRYAIYAAKLIFGVAILVIVGRNVKNQTFFKSERSGKYLYNAVPGLLILSTLLSPLIWEHHGVFLALPFLVLLKRLSSGGEYLLFGFAYFLEFIFPTFDFFPWSYGRLLAPLICLGLCGFLSGKQDFSPVFETTEQWLMKLSFSFSDRKIKTP